MNRPIVYDATHLVSRGSAIGAAGIGGVDLSYARHFAPHPRFACGVHYAFPRPHIFSRERVAALVAESAPTEGADDGWPMLRAWLLGAEQTSPSPRALARGSRWRAIWRQTRLRLANDASHVVPASAIYLNIAQHACEFPLLFDWLGRRPDLRPVFFVHDLLPLDYPEFFRPGYERLFRRRLDTILHHACALITTTHVVAERLQREFRACGTPPLPIHVQPLASSLGLASAADHDDLLAASCYFVAVSTLEPRKNHLLLLNVWRALAASGGPCPKLVLVGGEGWENEQTLDMLRRCDALRRNVRRVHGLSTQSLRHLIGNADALLMPSFAEGYGLPVVEALSLRTPAIVSDIPAFREVTQGRALLLSPIDGKGWKETILAFADRRGARRLAAVDATGDFVAPTTTSYFAGVEAFLDGL